MTKKTLPFLFFLFLFLNLSMAQESAYVLHVSGQVFYYASFGAKPKTVSPGMKLDIRGKIRCKGAGSARLLYNGGALNVSGGKMRDIQDLVKSVSGNGKVGFTGRFINFMEESIREGESHEKLKQYHEKYMNNSVGGIKGYGRQEFAITPILSSSGNIPFASVSFRWRDINRGEGAYIFRLESASGATIAQLMTYDTSVTLNIPALAVKKGNDYKWSVIQTAGTGKSPAIPVVFVPAMIEEVRQRMQAQKEFTDASPLEQQLMIAYGLEEDGALYEAAQVYGRLYADNPNNLLLRKVYASFLARRDMLSEAKTILSFSTR